MINPPNLSANIELHTTKYDLINLAFQQLNMFGEDESINAFDYDFAGRTLNLMLKSWMAVGFELWLKKTCYLFPQAYQTTYSLYNGTTDNFTLDYNTTNLSSNGSTGDTFIVVNSVSDITTGDYIGVILDTSYMYWARVGVIVGTTINFSGSYALPSSATSGNRVINYTTPLDNILSIYSGVRSSDFDIDVSLNYLSYDEYLLLPNKKDTSSTPVSFMYDRQLEQTNFSLWPTPDTADLRITFTIAQKVKNIDTNNQEPDFPEEWHEAIYLGLAVRMAPKYSKNKGEGFMNLVSQARESYNRALAFDNEIGSIYFRPNYTRG